MLFELQKQKRSNELELKQKEIELRKEEAEIKKLEAETAKLQLEAQALQLDNEKILKKAQIHQERLQNKNIVIEISHTSENIKTTSFPKMMRFYKKNF